MVLVLEGRGCSVIKDQTEWSTIMKKLCQAKELEYYDMNVSPNMLFKIFSVRDVYVGKHVSIYS